MNSTFQSETFSIDSSGTTLFAFDLQRKNTPSIMSGKTTAKLLDESDKTVELDRLDLAKDDELYPNGMRLFAVVSQGRRSVRLEISGPDATNWSLAGPPYAFQSLSNHLEGYEEWYRNREDFYSSSYFQRTEEGKSGYTAREIDTARAAQDLFVSEVLRSVSFKSSLEFGCATGAMVAALRSRKIKATGVDLSEFVINQSNKRIRPFLFVGDFSYLDSKDLSVDAVIGQEVFEHILPDEIPEVFRKIHQVCSHWLIMTIPCLPEYGLSYIDQFDHLPKDREGNPFQGHLIQASWWWWAAQAILAGFEVDLKKTLEIRRRWNEHSRWWNLFLCQRCEDVSDSSTGRRLDKIIRTCFEALRQDLRPKYIATGRLLRNEGSLSILCGNDDLPGYIYYGPYLNIINAKIDIHIDFRKALAAKTSNSDINAPTVYFEISSSNGIHHSQNISISQLDAPPGEWTTFSNTLELEDAQALQFKIYFTGNHDIEVAWPIQFSVKEI